MRNYFGTLALAAALALSTAATAQEKQHGGPSEGIKVHGHWTIEIRNPDGSLASHSEFENSLTGGGKSQLAGMLAMQETVMSWSIVLADGSSGGPCGSSSPTFCQIPALPGVHRDVSGASFTELNGSITASQDSVVRRLNTTLTTSYSTYGFSQRLLEPAEEKSVVKGQIIQVTVVFTFS